MKKHSDYITHIQNPEDAVYLKTPHFPVNMRLFESSPEYRSIIKSICDYIKFLCSTEKEGYKIPHGMSSANAGMSFNIIAYTVNRGKPNARAEVMINPVITTYYGDTVISSSNCGSLTLDKPIPVERHSVIDVEYYDEDGNFKEQTFNRLDGSFTIQHEVDHNLGILITDKQ